MPSIDFHEVKRLVSIQRCLELSGWRPVRRDRGGWHGRCPMCGSRSARSETLSVTTTDWYCHRCCTGGSVIDLFGLPRGLSTYQAAIELCEAVGVAVPYQVRQPRHPHGGRAQR